MEGFLGLIWLQVGPIITHRPTQGISGSIVERGALQVESGYQPLFQRGATPLPELIAQVRVGLGRRSEGFLTHALTWPPARFSLQALAFKQRLYSSAFLTLTAALWGYAPLSSYAAGLQLWLLADLTPSPRGTLTLNAIGGYFGQPQVVLAGFYTHSFTDRLFGWVEGFAYLPESGGTQRRRSGGGLGFQYILGKAQRTAIDLAFNAAYLPNERASQLQVLFGLSRKFAFRVRQMPPPRVP
ncbi:MAG: hypothetical protein ABDH91_00080 [Bacteroidia bacterium]